MQMDWREQFRMIAGIADRQPQAEAWLRRYDQLCYEANLQLDRLLGTRGTAVIWEFGTSSAYCFSSSYGHGCQILYGDLGFQPPGVLMEHGLMNRGYLEIPAEHIADYPADHIFSPAALQPLRVSGASRPCCAPPAGRSLTQPAAGMSIYSISRTCSMGLTPLFIGSAKDAHENNKITNFHRTRSH